METEEKVVQEAEEVTPAPEAEKTEEAPETAATEAEKPDYYTPEEIEEVLSSDGKLDRNRLSPEGRLLQKSFEKGLYPKLQERTELRRRVEELEKRTTPQTQPATIEEAYQRDPQGTLRYIDSEIMKHKARLDEDPLGSIKEIENLRTVKDYLRDQEILSTRQQLKAKDVADSVERTIYKEIPDFDEKRDKLTEFAKSRLGFTDEEIIHQSDVTKVGQSASKFVSMINRMYDMENAAKTVQKKEVKTVPKTETAGRGDADAANTTYQAAVKRAQKSGDWTDVLKIKGTLQRLTPN